ncbi:MAG: SCO family protein [Candidatus Eremiobacteraeota bacterium]|nr:SCO family protein [Candidatus Eremiobacteraeota bacterium]
MRASLRTIACALAGAIATACNATGGAPDFTLRDDAGTAWSLSQQRGTAVLLTFGFTHCADTCPMTLAKLARVARAQRKPARPIEVAFVTVDPKRDTVAVMHRFVGRFTEPRDDDVVGLTGTFAQIARVKAAYHVWSQPLRNGDIAHTAVIVLIDARGRIAGTFDDDESQASLSHAISATLTS